MLNARPQEELEPMKKNDVKIEFLEPNYVTDSTLMYRCRIIINGETISNDFHLSKIDQKWYVDIIK